jgi:hypothetical protein
MSAAGVGMLFETRPTRRSMDAANVPLSAACSFPTLSLTVGESGVTRANAMVTFRRTARAQSRHVHRLHGSGCRAQHWLRARARY